MHLADFCTASGAVQGSWMYRVGKFCTKRQTILDKLETREVGFKFLGLFQFCHLENWEVSSNKVSIGISFPAEPKPECKKYCYWANIVSDNRERNRVGRAMYEGRPDWAVAQIYIFTLYPGPKFTQPTFTQNPHLHNTKFTWLGSSSGRTAGRMMNKTTTTRCPHSQTWELKID